MLASEAVSVVITRFFFGRKVPYEFLIFCPGLFSALIFICFAHAGSLKVFRFFSYA